MFCPCALTCEFPVITQFSMLCYFKYVFIRNGSYEYMEYSNILRNYLEMNYILN